MKRELKKQQVRSEILRACASLYREKGFDETTVSDITDLVNISRQTFFNYFSGKQAVLAELGLQWLQQQSQAPRLRPDSPQQGSYWSGMRKSIVQQVIAIKADKAFMKLVFTRSGLLNPQIDYLNEDLISRQQDYSRTLFTGVASIISVAQSNGEIRNDIDPVQIAEMLVTVMLNTVRLWLINYWQDDMDIEERINKALDVFERGLLN